MHPRVFNDFRQSKMGKKSKNAWVQRQAVPFYTQIKDLDKRASTHPTQYQHFVKTQPNKKVQAACAAKNGRILREFTLFEYCQTVYFALAKKFQTRIIKIYSYLIYIKIRAKNKSHK